MKRGGGFSRELFLYYFVMEVSRSNEKIPSILGTRFITWLKILNIFTLHNIRDLLTIFET